MATTLTGSGITFSDSSSQATAVPAGYKEIYSGVLPANNWKHSGNFSTTDLNPIYQLGFWWTLKYGSNQNTREFLSSDSFLFHTTTNDYYTNNSNPSGREFNMHTTYKAISLGRGLETRLSYLIERGDFYPYPNQINLKIFATTATIINSAVYGGQIINDTIHLPAITGPSKWARPF